MRLSDEQILLRDTARDVARNLLAPHSAGWDREARFPKEALSELGKLGFAVTPSVANFVLFHFDDDGAKTATEADAYLKSQGVILRKVGAYGFPNALRMTIGSENDNRRAIAALSQYLDGAA